MFKKIIILCVCFFGISAVLIYGRYIEPENIVIRNIDVSPDIDIPALKNKKLIHISDLHMKKIGDRQQRLLNLIDQIGPDLIFLTGDYIKWRSDNKGAIDFLSRLKAKYGVFAVMGDYDYSNSRNSCLFCHESGKGAFTKQHQVAMLRNSVTTVNIDGQQIKIAGFDEGYESPDFLGRINNIEVPEDFLLLLSHSPLPFDQLSCEKKVFMFSGDTHGGQVRLPEWLFRVFGYEKNVKYNYGLFSAGQKHMYVTRGIGTSHVRFRLFCPPELAVFHF